MCLLSLGNAVFLQILVTFLAFNFSYSFLHSLLATCFLFVIFWLNLFSSCLFCS